MTIPAALALAGLTALSGCKPQITNANIAVVKRALEDPQGKGGVSPKEVESMLGQPKRVEVKSMPLETQKKEVEVVRYYYEQDGQTLELHFVDNKLVSPIPELAPKKPAATPQP